MARTKLHRPECQQYRLWKKQEALKSKEGTKAITKKKKGKEAITDCIEEEETKKTEEPLKVNYRKCKKKKMKRFEPRKSEKYVIKCVSFTEIVLKRIKPSLEEREQLINPRHTACLQDGTTKTNLKTVEEISTTSPIVSVYEKDRQKVYERKKSKGKRKQWKESEKVAENKENELGKNGEDAEDKEGKEVKKAESKKKVQRRGKKKRKMSKPKMNEDSKCDSICSFDSEVCLAGLKMTSEDKKKIQVYLRKGPSARNEDKR